MVRVVGVEEGQVAVDQKGGTTYNESDEKWIILSEKTIQFSRI